MKIKLLIATHDIDYVEHLSNVLSEKHSDTFDVSVCSSIEHMRSMLSGNKFDVGLIEPTFMSDISAESVRLPLLLMDESGNAEDYGGAKRIRKYQRISSIAGNVLENYAEISTGVNKFDSDKARITAVWSPSGGSGKTTVALAFAANNVLSGKSAVYLNLECFSSTSVYFQDNGRSISKAFEKLESNVHLFLAGIRQQDSSSGISYFCEPENYDDMNILTKEDTRTGFVNSPLLASRDNVNVQGLSTRTVTAHRLNVRSGPGIDHSYVGVLHNGDIVHELARVSGGWVRITYSLNGFIVTGYVHGHYLN